MHSLQDKIIPIFHLKMLLSDGIQKERVCSKLKMELKFYSLHFTTLSQRLSRKKQQKEVTAAGETMNAQLFCH